MKNNFNSKRLAVVIALVCSIFKDITFLFLAKNVLISFHVEAGDLWQLRWIILSVDTCVQRRAKTHRFWNGGRKKTNPCATNVKKLRGFDWLFFTTADTSLTHQFHSYFIWFLIHARNEIDNFAVKKFSRNLFLFARISNRFIFELRQKYT